jgi:hypothetical protein
MLVSALFVGVAAVPFVPLRVTTVSAMPDVEEMLANAGCTAKLTALLDKIPSLTTTSPVVASLGTDVIISGSLQVVGLASVPLKLTVLAPCAAPKLVPVIVTTAPIAPDIGKILLTEGGTRTVNFAGLLANPFTVTTRLPVAALLAT